MSENKIFDITHSYSVNKIMIKFQYDIIDEI